FAQAPWAGAVGTGVLRTTPDAPVYAGDVLPAPYMVLAKFGSHTLNEPYSQLYDFFSPHPSAGLFLFADASVRPVGFGVAPPVLQALGTRDGGEPLGGQEF